MPVFLVGMPDVAQHNGKEQAPPVNCHIVNVGQRRKLDVAVEVPGDELGAIATNAIWSDVYDRVADLIRQHRSTLVFVNTRRLAERVAHHLAERLGEDQVVSHHGSLSRKIRLHAEERLKTGRDACGRRHRVVGVRHRYRSCGSGLSDWIATGHLDLYSARGAGRALGWSHTQGTVVLYHS